MIRVKQTHHINIVVGELERARKFYEQVMGLSTIASRPNLSRPGVWYHLGDKQLHVTVVQDAPPPSSFRHVAIEVEDFDEAVRVLAENKIQTLENTPDRRANG